MAEEYACPTLEVRVRPMEARPLLSILAPTFNRPDELTIAVSSIADQLVDGLQDRVEIVISDNASHKGIDAIRALHDRYPTVSYYLNAENIGPGQVATAPWRSRGRWLWMFGDDDVLLPGGVQRVVKILETAGPAFLTLNRCVTDNALERVIQAAKHDTPDRTYPTFLDMVARMGVDQLSFFTSQVYATDVARRIDPRRYVESRSFYSQIAYFFDGFHDQTAAYDNAVHVVHRWQPDDETKHAANFYHLGATLPPILAHARDLRGLPKDLMERISGEKSVQGETRRDVTYVDNILQNLWRCAALEYPLTDDDWAFLAGEAANWEPHRLQQLHAVRERSLLIRDLRRRHSEGAAPADSRQPDSLKRLMAMQTAQAAAKLATSLNDARREAMETAALFD